jgi:hypothetical protein
LIVLQEHHQPCEWARGIDWWAIGFWLGMRWVIAVQALTARRAQARAAGAAQRVHRQICQDILPQHLVEVDLVVFVDARLIVLLRSGWLNRHAGTDVRAGQELFVQYAFDSGDGFVEAAGALDRNRRNVL